MGGIVAIVLVRFGIRIQADEEEIRGLIALSILPVALLTMLIAHGIAARQAMKHDHRIRPADGMIS